MASRTVTVNEAREELRVVLIAEVRRIEHNPIACRDAACLPCRAAVYVMVMDRHLSFVSAAAALASVPDGVEH